MARPKTCVPSPRETATGETALDEPSAPGHLALGADYPALGPAEEAESEVASVEWVKVVP